MGMIEAVKALGIKATDCLNPLSDPFDDFTRPAIYPAASLKALEEEFYQDFIGHFWGCDGRVLLHRIPLPAGSPLDTGDQAIWHGVYTAMLALRYNGLPEGEQKSEVYGHIIEAAKGLRLHQEGHGESKPRLIRGVSDDLKTWQDDASNDSATGHLLGIYFGWKFGPPTMRPVFEQLAGGLAAEVLNHDHALVRADGSKTTYGALEQGWKTDPLRISLALAIYAVAATITKVPEFMKAYSDLYSKYGDMACYPKARLWLKIPFKPIVMDNQNDTHRGAIHLAILADLTTGKPLHKYMAGLQRLRGMVRKFGNIWVNELCRFGYGNAGPFSENGKDDRTMALKVLSEFTLKDQQFNDGRDNTTFKADWFRVVKQGEKLMANQPLPRHLTRAQDFCWQRNLSSLDPGSEGAQADSRLNNAAWLCAYWLARQNKTLNDAD